MGYVRIYPVLETTATVPFFWDAVAGATSYVLQVGTSSGASNVHNADVGNATAHNMDVGAARYFSRVVPYTGATPMTALPEQVLAYGLAAPPPSYRSGGFNFNQFIRSDRTLWAGGVNNRGQLGVGSTADGMKTGVVVADASNSDTHLHTDLTEADDFWNGATLLITSGALSGQTDPVTDFAQTGGAITVMNGFTGTPAADVTFTIARVAPLCDVTAIVVADAENSVTVLHTDRTEPDGYWNGAWLKFDGAPGVYPIVSYVQTGGVVTLGIYTGSTPKPAGTIARIYMATWATVECGYNHVLAIKESGELWVWGYGGYGGLGLGNNSDVTVPTKLGSDTWAAVSAGDYFSLGIKTDGTLWGWGMNIEGQVGIGSNADQHILSPAQIGTDNTWVSVAAGQEHALGLKLDGTLWAWGHNDRGELGDGTIIDQYAPVQIGTATWTRISAGLMHNLALKSDGTLWTWGGNFKGQLGDGTFDDQHAPVQLGVGQTFTSISAKNDTTHAVRSDGTLWGCGDNEYGQVGDGDIDGVTTDKWTFGQIGTAADWLTVQRAMYAGMGTRLSGVYTWGRNEYGQLAQESVTRVTTPTLVDMHDPT